MISENLIRRNKGIIDVHCDLICSGDKTLIVRDKCYNKVSGEIYYVMNQEKVHGVVQMDTPYKITVKEFQNLSDKHMISDEERMKWWPSKEILFAYPITVIDTFEPKTINILKDNGFFKEFEHSEEIHQELQYKKEKKMGKIAKLGFYPMKSQKMCDNLKDFKQYLGEIDDKLAIEKKLSGIRGILVKQNEKTFIFSEDREDITDMFPEIAEQAHKLSSKEFMIDGTLVIKDMTKQELSDMVGLGIGCEDFNVEFHAFDILRYGDGLNEKPWNERKSILNELNFQPNIKQVRSIIVDNSNDALKAIKIISELPGSDGAVIKDVDCLYDCGVSERKLNDKWINFENVTIENRVEKRGAKYCVVHGHPQKPGSKTDKPEGSIIKCFPSKAEADKMHKAIIISQTKQMAEDAKPEERKTSAEKSNFFKGWSQDIAYVVGYMTADAHIYREKDRLEFSSDDKQILSMMKSKLGWSAEKIKPVGTYFVLRHVSPQQSKDLIAKGYTQLKDNRTTYKGVPSQYINDYIRGYMDGDGTLDSERDKLQIDTPNVGLARWMFAKLKAVGGDGVHIYKYAQKMRKVAVTKDTKKVLAWIYKGGQMFLKRKKSTARKIKNAEEPVYATSEDEKHRHTWRQIDEYTNVINEHKHKINIKSMIAEKPSGGDHTHKLLKEEKLQDTTTASPGVDKVQGSKLVSGPKGQKTKKIKIKKYKK